MSIPKSYTEKQKLVDICFEIAIAVRDNRDAWKDTPELAVWVAKQLRECGFPTRPVGSSWGVLER